LGSPQRSVPLKQMSSSPCPIYHGRIDFERVGESAPHQVESLLDQYYEENPDIPFAPILRKYEGEDAFIFDIPADWHTSLKTFEKQILRWLQKVEELTETKVIGGFINVFDIYGVEEGKKTKFLIRRADKIQIVKSIVDPSKYFAMVKYLKNSTPENLAFYESLQTKK
jgi:hypothetical protein